MKREIIVPIAIVALAVAFLDPFMVLMPTSLILVLMILLLLAALGYSLLIWQEKPVDEREYHLRAYAGRMSFIAAVALLSIGIVYQALVTHEVDPFLIATLAVMTIVKYFSYIYAQNEH